MRDEITEDLWTHFPSETPMTFLDWGTSPAVQPNNGRASNCGAYWASFDYHMVDEPCWKNYNPICEMSWVINLSIFFQIVKLWLQVVIHVEITFGVFSTKYFIITLQIAKLWIKFLWNCANSQINAKTC